MSIWKQQSEEEKRIEYRLHIMKALGWYINTHKAIKQNELAAKLHVDAAVINRGVISPKNAESVTVANYKEKGIRLITTERALEICSVMETTLENILYYYQFRTVLTNSPKMDSLEKLTNQLTEQASVKNLKTQPLEFDGVFLQRDLNTCPKEEVNNLISDVNHPSFGPWFGKYYCYFSSTSSEETTSNQRKSFDKASDDNRMQELLQCAPEEHIFCGILDINNKINEKDTTCHVNFEFLANPKKKLSKKYSGVLMLSSNTNAVFCELESKKLGEKTYFILEKQDLGSDQPQVQCCMAMVLTYSSIVHRRRPCCERMVISRKRILEKTVAYENMKANLRINDNVIRITQWGYEELLKDINRTTDSDLLKIKELFPNLESLSGNNVTIEKCAFMPESVIHTLHSLTDIQKQKFENLLRIHSIAPWYCKIKSTKADVLFKLLNGD